MKTLNKLTPRAVAQLLDSPVTKGRRVSDGAGLFLFISPSDAPGGRARWVYRFAGAGGRIREMGLGSARVISLADARSLARDARLERLRGDDPISARRERLRASAPAPRVPTFGVVALEVIASRSQSWRSEKHAAQWRSTLQRYCASIWSRPVDAIETAAVLDMLTPLWGRAPQTASHLRSRIEAVLDAATARGFRSGDNPARWRGHLEHLLPRQSKAVRHHPALPYSDVPAFMAALREQPSAAARALVFCILTAARAGEVLGAKWDEIDTAGVWTVPAERYKTGKAHRVPLSNQAMTLLRSLPRDGDLVFQQAGRRLPQAAMWVELKLLEPGVTVHGMRSAMRDWCGDETNHSREVAEGCLGHVVGGVVERAYRRGSALDKRRALMQDWADYCNATVCGTDVPRCVTTPATPGFNTRDEADEMAAA
jgi:integrase